MLSYHLKDNTAPFDIDKETNRCFVKLLYSFFKLKTDGKLWDLVSSISKEIRSQISPMIKGNSHKKGMSY